MLSLPISPDVVLSSNILPIVEDLKMLNIDGIHITSNLRSEEVNKSVGGVNNSLHLCGKAVDLRLRTLNSHKINRILELKEKGYTVLIEKDHIHIQRKDKC
jgi:uncharacterized protein YcbK (DUF882 family)